MIIKKAELKDLQEIFYMDEKIYECYFHGGVIR